VASKTHSQLTLTERHAICKESDAIHQIRFPVRRNSLVMTSSTTSSAGTSPHAQLNLLQKQLDELRDRLTAHPKGDAIDLGELGRLAQEIFRSRQQRAAIFRDDDLFGEPAWDIFLALYTAHEAQHKLSLTDVCGVAGVPLATGLRWIGRLEKDGWVYRAADPVDRRRSWLNLTERALNVMRDYLAGLSLRPSQGLDFP
jgi:MarR family transcriptional regulator, temperature-dependent positive regulator of motility